jgi:hypothetical protein
MSGAALLAVTASLLAAAPPSLFDAARLWDAWPAERFVETAAPCLRHADLSGAVDALAKRFPGQFSVEEIGRSLEGRPIRLLKLGSGRRRVLLWSQMHGDEPSATPAVLDLVSYVLAHRGDRAAQRLLEGATLLIVPMLNPDGAERYERRNTQGIDINRDALNLATPEGRLLKAVRDRYAPELGFNLHDQNRRTTVGATDKLASISLLAVSGDPQGTLTPGRARAKRVCSAIVAALSRYVPGGIARYDEDWSPRAFGDNITAWGTPVVLIESGGFPAGTGYEHLTRLNFVALLAVLDEFVRNDLAARDDRLYEALPRNASGSWSDVVVRGGRLLQPGIAEAYRADVAFDVVGSDRAAAACAGAPRRGSRVSEIGDARFLFGRDSVDASGLLVLPAFTASLRGVDARAWLDAPALTAWARAGIGRVLWHVLSADRPAAEAHAAPLGKEGLPRLEIVGESDASAALRLGGPPAAARSPRLSDVLDALKVAAEGRPADLRALVDDPTALTRPRGGRLSVDAPANLALVRSSGDDLILAAVTLEAVFLDGQRVAAAK